MHGNPPCIVTEVQDLIHLKHFGHQEILKKIDLMEGEYDLPMRFDEMLIPDPPAAAGQPIGEWGYGVAIFGAAWGHCRARETPSLMADMYGFASEEEMSDTKAYLQSHRNYQLEHVSAKRLVAL